MQTLGEDANSTQKSPRVGIEPGRETKSEVWGGNKINLNVDLKLRIKILKSHKLSVISWRQKSGLFLAPWTPGELVHTQTHQHWRHFETSKRVCECVCEYMCDTRGVTSIPEIQDIFTVSFTEAPRLSARQEVLFGVDHWSLWFPVVFDSLGSMLHHFPSEADEQCHSSFFCAALTKVSSHIAWKLSNSIGGNLMWPGMCDTS